VVWLQDFFPTKAGADFQQLFSNQFASTLASFVANLLHDLDNDYGPLEPKPSAASESKSARSKAPEGTKGAKKPKGVFKFSL
jgi:hypothetical protein